MKFFYRFIEFVFIISLTFLFFLGCSQPAPESTLEPASQVVFEYWAAFNSYDTEAALSYYEESYREQEREGVGEEIELVKRYSRTLTLEEVSEPVAISEGKVEVRTKLSTPIGPKYLEYHLIDVDGEWKICKESGYEPTDQP